MSTEKVQKIIDENAVVVFSKSYCPYCVATKRKLRGMKAKFELLELNKMKEGGAIQAALQEITQQSTVPNIFINHKHIGGDSELRKLSNDQLKAMLKEAGAIKE